MTPVKRASDDESDAVLDLHEVDRRDATLLHEQIAGEIRRAIAEGEALPGKKIPFAKDLAAVLGVSTNTMLRALRILRDEGLLEMGRGRAIRVAGTSDQGAVVEKARDLIAFARQRGYQKDELVGLMQALP